MLRVSGGEGVVALVVIFPRHAGRKAHGSETARAVGGTSASSQLARSEAFNRALRNVGKAIGRIEQRLQDVLDQSVVAAHHRQDVPARNLGVQRQPVLDVRRVGVSHHSVFVVLCHHLQDFIPFVSPRVLARVLRHEAAKRVVLHDFLGSLVKAFAVTSRDSKAVVTIAH